MDLFRLALAALALLASGVGALPPDARAEAPVPASVKRTITARFPHTDRFYLPGSLPPLYRYSHWERGEFERYAGERTLAVFTIHFTPPGRTWVEQIRAGGRWAQWRQLRLLAPCRAVYAGGKRTLIAGRRVVYLAPRGRQIAAFCERGYAVELTLSDDRVRALTLVRLVARAEVVTR